MKLEDLRKLAFDGIVNHDIDSGNKFMTWVEKAHAAMSHSLARLRNTDTDHAKELRRLTK